MPGPELNMKWTLLLSSIAKSWYLFNPVTYQSPTELCLCSRDREDTDLWAKLNAHNQKILSERPSRPLSLSGSETVPNTDTSMSYYLDLHMKHLDGQLNC